MSDDKQELPSQEGVDDYTFIDMIDWPRELRNTKRTKNRIPIERRLVKIDWEDEEE